MIDAQPAASRSSGTTAWARSLQTPLRQFLNTETGSAAVLAGATVAALIWANISDSSYERVWSTELQGAFGSATTISMDLREFVNSGTGSAAAGCRPSSPCSAAGPRHPPGSPG